MAELKRIEEEVPTAELAQGLAKSVTLPCEFLFPDEEFPARRDRSRRRFHW
jgi:hypothetical protein